MGQFYWKLRSALNSQTKVTRFQGNSLSWCEAENLISAELGLDVCPRQQQSRRKQLHLELLHASAGAECERASIMSSSCVQVSLLPPHGILPPVLGVTPISHEIPKWDVPVNGRSALSQQEYLENMEQLRSRERAGQTTFVSWEDLGEEIERQRRHVYTEIREHQHRNHSRNTHKQTSRTQGYAGCFTSSACNSFARNSNKCR